MQGTTNPGGTPSGGATGQSQSVVLTSRAWGHEGGNLVTAEFRNPGVGDSPLMVSVIGTDILVTLATDSTGALSSTAAQVVAAINASADAADLVKALTYRGNAGLGIVQPRAKVNLSDFLNAPAHVQRGQFQPEVLRIGKRRDGNHVGIFLYCQQHAREWATPLTCLETAEQLLRNYALDPDVRRLVDNLDVFILPASNPDGAHYSMYDFASQRKNMTNHCVNGGKVTDDPFAADFWTPRTNPSTGLPYTNTDPGSRTAWGVDNNRNNTVERSSTATSARRTRARARRTPARRRHPSRRSRTSSGSLTRSRTSSSRTTSTASAATSCGRRARISRTAARARSSTRTSASRSTSSRPATGSSTASRRSGARSSSRSAPVRSRTSSTRRRATAPTSTGTTAA